MARDSGLGLVVDLPEPPRGEEPQPRGWRWLEFRVEQACPRGDLQAFRAGRPVARSRQALPSGELARLALPDLGPGPLEVRQTGCELAIVDDEVLATAGIRSDLHLLEVEGWQRYRNLGARPYLEAVGDVEVVSGMARRLDLLGAPWFDRIVVEQPPPADAGGIALLDPPAVAPDWLDVDVLALDGSVLLVVREVHAPGWKATIDGEPAPIEFVDHAFRGVWVPEGRHNVRFEYRPDGLADGIVAAVAGAGVMVLLGASGWGGARRRRSASLPN